MDPSDVLRWAQVVFGIGLVIFVHELGHYLAARMMGVRVETFSLGFGPRLLGFRRGATMYQVALVPLGGFCKMAGEERRLDGLEGQAHPARPDELYAKGVGARFFIFSGGVLMNMLFGLVVFPILFQVGVPFTRPLVGEATPGGAAWRARIPEGSEILEVNGSRVFEFEHVFTAVALGDPDRVTLRLRDPGSGAERALSFAPEFDEREGLYTIGIRPGPERDEAGRIVLDVLEDSPAWRAGLRHGDRLVRVENGAPGLDEPTQLELLDRAGLPWILTVAGAGGERRVEVAPELTPRTNPPRIGVSARQNLVRAVRPSPTLAALGLEAGDALESVNGEPILSLGDLPRALLAADGPVHAVVRRGGRTLELAGPALSREEALALADDIAIGPDEAATTVVVQPGDPAARAGLRTLDEVLEIDGTEVEAWQDISELVARAGAGREVRVVTLRVRRPGTADHLTIAVAPERRPVASYGLSLRQAEYVYRSESLGAALAFGAQYSWRFLVDSWLTLKRMLSRQISPKNVGGIITISAVSYSLTEDGWVEFLFFLCLVSINLAFLNVLPIPVLDGGHLLFLLIEKLKGSPVSNRVLGTSQAIGVVLLLSLMVYVTYNDLMRWVFGP